MLSKLELFDSNVLGSIFGSKTNKMREYFFLVFHFMINLLNKRKHLVTEATEALSIFNHSRNIQ